MTKEELEKEAKEWCKSRNFTPSNVGYFASDYCEQSYIAGAEPREKRIEELEQQIEKMQCCENCIRYKPCITCNETIGNNCDYYKGGNVCNKWQLN